jgi:DNA-binding NtrC family response regulator
MPSFHEFLVVDDHVDNRFLLTKTLIRKFPNALIQECQESSVAMNAVARRELTAAIVHRAADADGLDLIMNMRAANPMLPILYVSGVDKREQGLRAGATAFLHYDAWLSVGTAVDDMLMNGKTAHPFSNGRSV